MLNKKSFKEVTDYKLGKKYYKPHDRYNIKFLLNSIYKEFGINSETGLPEDCFEERKKYDNVLLIIIDGLSYYLYEKYEQELSEEARQFFQKNFTISKITTIFPTSTTSVIPYLMTGYLPEESGLYEWWQYESNADEIICPFLYVYRRNLISKDMNELGIDPKSIYMKSRFYEKLQREGINVTSISRKYDTPFNDIANRDINVITGEYIKEYFRTLSNMDMEGRNFFYVYEPIIDYFQHKYGVDSKECKDGVIEVLEEVYKFVSKIEEKGHNRMRIIITADHGLVDVDHRDILFLDKEMADLKMYLKENKKGVKILNGGSPGACVLHVKEELLEDFVKESKKYISKYGQVFTIKELEGKGVFSTELSDRFRKNIGNVIFLAYEGKGIWFEEDMSVYKGLHGGLSEKEMHIPLFVY